MSKDLEGLLVVSVEQAVAAPYASCRLADAGARVIKVERPEGDFARRYDAYAKGHSANFVWLNRGKESLTLNLKDAGDLGLFQRLLAKADVFIQNLAPGAMARLGLDPETLAARYPRLISCEITGYGSEGPYSHLKAYDLLVQAESGLVGVNGTAEAAARVGVSVCDIAAGMTAHQAILQALIGRARTGKGRHIEVSLFHAMADWMNVPYLQFRYGHETPPRAGLNHPSIAPYGAYACGDGKAVLISIQNEREWQRLCSEVLGRAEIATDTRFATNPQRVANRQALDGIILDVFGRVTREAMVERLEKAAIAYGRQSSLDDLVHHPQARFIAVRTSHGEIELLAPGAVVRGERLEGGSVPAVGEHDAAIRAELAATE